VIEETYREGRRGSGFAVSETVERSAADCAGRSPNAEGRDVT
jgi:hypothetical protein